MKTFTPLLLTIILLAECSNPKDSTNINIETQLDSLFSTVPDFSGVALVADKGTPIYHKAFGFRDVNTGVPNDTTSIFELASVSKQFTSMAIMMLKEEGKLSYEDPLEKHISGLPYKWITIRHLLNHTSGLPDYQSVMDQHWDKTKVAANKDNIEYLGRYAPPVLFQPGAKYEYSNTGYMLLGSIVEAASGHDFISFCKARIFVPVKMSSTGIRTRDEKVQLKNMAWGHIYVPEKQAYMRADSFPGNNYAIWLGNRVGPGRVSSTSTDLLKWDRALYTNTLVSNVTLKEAFTPARLKNDSLSNYGFGWELGTYQNHGEVVRHSGSNPGYSTHIIRFVDKDMVVILLSNNEHERFNELLDGMVLLSVK
jgi:CubicO group peptidase (beta-lactamase class C family)